MKKKKKKKKKEEENFLVFHFKSPTGPRKPSPPLSPTLLPDPAESHRHHYPQAPSFFSFFLFFIIIIFNSDYPQTEPPSFHITIARLHNPVHMPPTNRATALPRLATK
jgi:hypothetical protein